MFYYLNGTITVLDTGLAVVDCGGVGYACHTTNYTLSKLQVGKQAKLFTYCNIKEDAFDIYGFFTREELNCFERLLGVGGVGPKAALAILSVVTPDQFLLAVMTQDEKTLTMAQGVGKKMAQRILLELKDKLAPAQLELSDGITKAQVQIVGFKADTLTDDGLPAGITFMFRTPIAMRAVNDSAATGGWEQSSLREWLADEGMATLPDDLRNQIRSVRKLTNNTGGTKDASSITATDDKLWLPSMSELCGYQAPRNVRRRLGDLSALYSGEGEQYQLYREQGVSGLTANDAMIRTVAGQKICYWERTPSADCSEGANSTYFNRVGKDGDVFSWATPGNDPDQMTYVLPGFCI